MELQIGQNVSHYRLVEKIGEGGMGQVFKAWDSRLNRHVAVKALRTDRTGDQERRQRFLQEARAASALNHPNIVTIYDIFSEQGADFMVMEFVSGKTLSQEIPKGGLRVSQALKLSIQIASALKMAHDAGIIHRDLKPGNVMVTPLGLVKLLDFGLAKLTQVSIEENEETKTDIGAPLTIQGSVMGTARYMSPEQAEGMPVDARSDIFTFGVVLYEMITGECAFHAATTMSTLAAVIRDNPRAVGEMVKDVPPALDDMINRCLRKAPKDRPQTIGEVHDLLGEVERSWESSTTPPTMINTPAKQEDVAPPTVAVGKAPAATPTPTAPGQKAPGKSAPAAAAKAVPKPVAKPAAKPTTGKKSSKTLVLAGIGVLAIAATIAAVVLIQRQAPVEPLPEPAPVAQVAPGPPPPAVPQPEPAAASPAPAAGPPPSAPAPKPQAQAQLRTKKAASPPNSPAPNSPAQPAQAQAPDPTQPEAQNQATPSAPTPTPAPKATQPQTTQPATPVVMANVVDGTRIRILLDHDVPATADSGNPISFVVGDDVRVGDLLVIAKGAVAKGVITEGSKKKFLRRSKVTMTLNTVEAVDGKQINLRESRAKKAGERKPIEVEPGGANPKSPDKSVEAPKGTFYFAFVDGDVLVKAKKNGH